MKRLFFALWPDAGTRDLLAEQAGLIQVNTGRRVPPENYHITLAFLGNVNEQDIPGLADAATGLSIPGFTLQIDHCGGWKRSNVAWLAPSHTPEPLLELARQIIRLSRLAGISVDERDYTPHLTIARKLARPVKPHAFEPIQWNVKEFCLAESVTHEKGARYRTLASCGLS